MAAKKTDQKTSTQTVRGLTIYPPRHPTIKKILAKQDGPEIHGDKVWFSSYFIMDYLDNKPPAKGSRVMEIGCGWGLLGIYCAVNFDSKVTAIDADKHVFPFLELHAKKNKASIKTKQCRYEDLKPKLLAKQDLIVGGDICFWDELVEPLHNLIRNALDNGVPRIIIADPGRPPFLKLARKCRKLYKAKVKSVAITKPRRNEGYLLIIHNPDLQAT